MKVEIRCCLWQEASPSSCAGCQGQPRFTHKGWTGQRADRAPVLEGSGRAAQQQGLSSQLRDFQGALHDDVPKLMQRGGLGRLCAGIALKSSGLRGCQGLQ